MDWIKYIKESENDALTKLYELHRDFSLSWLQKNYPVSMSDSLDIFQKSILILYDNVMTGKLTVLTADIKTYLFAILKNKCSEHLREDYRRAKNHRNYGYFTASDYNQNPNSQRAFDKAELLKNLLVEMGDPCKSLLEMFYYHKLNLESIMTKLNYANTNTVKTKKYKCIKRLQLAFLEHIE